MAASSPSSGNRAPIRETAKTQRLTIAPYSSYSGLRFGKPVTSGLFSLGGHRWDILFYPGGYYSDSPYAAVFLRLVSNLPTEQVRVLVDFTLVDRSGGWDDGYTRCAHQVFGPGLAAAGRCCGFAKFVLRPDLAASGFLSGDRLVFECAVRLSEDSEEVLRREPAARPLADELRRGLRRMLMDGTGADVTFVVRGESFRAHRCVLAALSPVFLAELYGPAARAMGQRRRDNDDDDDTTTITTITIDDMEPEAFAAMLRFAYDDTLPEPAAHGDRDAGVHMAQHLLAAADVYAMDALSQACQDRLGWCVTPGTAADTYALADKLNLPPLKAAVVRAVAASGHPHGIEAVKDSEGFRLLVAADAATAEELVRKVAAASGRLKRLEVCMVSSMEIVLASMGVVVFAGLALAAIHFGPFKPVK